MSRPKKAETSRAGWQILGAACVLLLHPVVAWAEDDSGAYWRLGVASPAVHLGFLECGCEWLGGDYTSNWALGATVRAERISQPRPWAVEVGVLMLSPAGRRLSSGRYEVAERPVHARFGIGPLFRPFDGRSADVQLYPRVGIVYGEYDIFSIVGLWGGLAVDGVWWMTEALGATASLDLRAGYWSFARRFDFEAGDNGILGAAELLVGVVVAL